MYFNTSTKRDMILKMQAASQSEAVWKFVLLVLQFIMYLYQQAHYQMFMISEHF